jgi:predicted AAA+ superfamily ATPase
MKRYSEPYILKDLQKKMVFIGGPRQVGKTTLSLRIQKDLGGEKEYLTYDLDEDRRAIIQKKWKKDCPVVIFDELMEILD